MTTHEPLTGTRIGLTVWFGSIDRGWTGKQVAPWKWNRTWRITSEPVFRTGTSDEIEWSK